MCLHVFAQQAETDKSLARKIRASERLIKNFDFDERDDGNLEEIPKYWEPMKIPGFPSYTRGAFDTEMGHDAPPSFRLESEGRSVAYRYLGPETRVRVNNDYRIQAYLKPDKLNSSKACLCAFFVTHTGKPIMDTMVRSVYVGSIKPENDWESVELYLPAAPTNAYTIGLAVWVLQESQWSDAQRRHRHIPISDVHGAVWIDDVSISSIPRVALSTSSPGNVLVDGEPATLFATLSDRMYGQLAGQLSITGAAGNLVESKSSKYVQMLNPSPLKYRSTIWTLAST